LLDNSSEIGETKYEIEGDQEAESADSDDHKQFSIANRCDESIPRRFRRSETSGVRQRLKFRAYGQVGHRLTPSFLVGAYDRHHCHKDERDWDIQKGS
jgi:hypothetical protein